MKKVLISACLIGDRVRYDAKDNLNPNIDRLLAHFELVPFCPEVEGGLPTPRHPSEIKRGRVYSDAGVDVTKHFGLGAQKALNICKYLQIDLAILKEDSPSCGVSQIHNGLFNKRKIPGQGVTTALLRQHGIEVISEDGIEALLEKHESKKDVSN
ncbi:MAG: DUF523 domain-containing protein [Bacilli bacterium]|jgi:uncharacterized protein YbbK (DUF523 family)